MRRLVGKEGATMPKLLHARPPLDAAEERQVRKLASSRHAPGDWIARAHMIVRSWEGLRTTAIAREVGCHPATVREKITRFNVDGLEGLGDRPGSGRRPRLTEAERSALIGLVATTPPGRLVRQADGTLAPARPEGGEDSQWSLDALAGAAQQQGIQVGRSQIRRILRREGVRWRRTHSWGTSSAKDFAPKEPRSSPATRTRPQGPRPWPSTNWGR
jgi:transposase